MHTMMSLKSLMFFLFMLIHAANALHPEDLLELSRMASNLDLDSVKELLTDAIADEIKSGISKESSEKDEKGAEDTSKSETDPSESRIEGSWLDLDIEPSSVIDHPDENDALYSRDSTNPSKRDDYYESLEKKSQRSNYGPPPRKNYYATPEVIDASSSEEHFHEERPDYRRPRMVDHEDYYTDRDHLADVIHAESHPLLESLHLIPAHDMYQSRAMQIPPWRFSQVNSYQKKPMPSFVPPPAVEEQPKSPEPSPDPLVTKAAVHKPRGTYKKSSASARRPSPVHIGKVHHHDESKFRSLPKSKPWVTEYKKEPIAPKFTAHDDKVFLPPSGFSKPIRQQFHEQGTRGPHSYKFGYSTGDRENPMARYEERDSDGIVRGSYSYVDPRGQKQVVHYESHPKFGFKTMTRPNF